jgi:hypothetical protein
VLRHCRSFSIYMSFHEWDIANPPVWAGLGNYTTLIGDELFRIAVFNTVYDDGADVDICYNSHHAHLQVNTH